MPILINNQLSFDVIETNNCKTIALLDTSLYQNPNNVEGKVLQVQPPNGLDTVELNYLQSAVTILNSNSLGITAVSDFIYLQDLPDGLYTAKISVCPYETNWAEKKWYRTSGSRNRLRIPVVVRFEDAYRFAIGEAFIGSSEKDSSNESILLPLDDSGMDIPLLSILRNLCPKQLEACAFWLEGLWGSLLQPDLPELAGRDDKGAVLERRFAVLKVDGIVQEKTGAIRVFVEEETPGA